MAAIVAHLSAEALRERYVSSSNAREARHFQTIWLLAKGHSMGEVAEMINRKPYHLRMQARLGELGGIRPERGVEAPITATEPPQSLATEAPGQSSLRTTPADQCWCSWPALSAAGFFSTLI
jgi:hypothetical protein